MRSPATSPEQPIPDLTSGFRAARAGVPAGVPPPAAERLLDADDDDAGVHQGGLQRAVRADRGGAAAGRLEDQARRRRRTILPDPAQGDHDLQPDADLSPDQRGRRSLLGAAYARLDDRHAVARHELFGAADSAERRSSCWSAWCPSRFRRCASRAGADERRRPRSGARWSSCRPTTSARTCRCSSTA